MELRALLPRRNHTVKVNSSIRIGRRKALLFRPLVVSNPKDISENVNLRPVLSRNPVHETEPEADSPIAFKIGESITPNLYGICEAQTPVETQQSDSRTLSESFRGQRTLNFKQVRRPGKLVRALLPRALHRKRGLSVTGRPLTPARLGKISSTQCRQLRSQLRTTSSQQTSG